MKSMKKGIVLVCVLALMIVSISIFPVKAAVTGQYTNPLMNGADPTIVRGDDGYFYSGFATDNDIYIKRSETLLGLSTADSHLVWDNPRSGSPDGNKNYYVWGPYIYRINGAWYIYFSSSTENDFGYGHPSCYVLENTSVDPFKGEWKLKGENTNKDDFEGNESKKAGLMNTESYGLACGVVTIAGEQYFTYTKYEYYKNEPGNTKFNECPTIVKMENPWTLTGEECTVARPTYEWELQLFSIDGGIRLDNTEVQENASEQSAEEYASYGSQYELADPVIPEGYDPSIPVKDGNALRYEAENAALENGAVKSTNHTGYSGDAFVEGMWNGDASVTFKINVEIAGKYTLALGYSNGYAETESERAAATYLNGTLAAPTLLPSTGFNDWDSWGESEFTLELQEGVNTIVFRNRKEDADGLQGDVNYDYLDVMKYPNTVSAEETKYTPLTDATGKRYEAEDAELSGSGVETEHNGFSGEGYVGKMYNGSAKIGFQAAVKETGEYTLQLRYANGHGEDVEDKYAAVFINGKYVEALELPKTGSWDEWKMTKPLKVNLNEGVSTIAFVNSSYHAGHSADVNYDYLDLITEQGTEQKEYSVTH